MKRVRGAAAALLGLMCLSAGAFTAAPAAQAATTADTLWARTYGGQSSSATALFTQPNGTLVLVGKADSAGASDIAVLRYDAAGTLLSPTRIDGPAHLVDASRCAAMDGMGNLYVAGVTDYVFSPSEQGRALLAKIDRNGRVLWTREYGGTTAAVDIWYAIALDPLGQPVVGGLRDCQGWAIAKYGVDGQLLWTRTVQFAPGGCDDKPTALALDETGAIYAGGFNFAFLPHGHVLKYSAGGDSLWRVDDDAAGNALAYRAGRLYTTGFDSGIACYDTSRALIWRRGEAGRAIRQAGDGWLMFSLVSSGSGGVPCPAEIRALDGSLITALCDSTTPMSVYGAVAVPGDGVYVTGNRTKKFAWSRPLMWKTNPPNPSWNSSTALVPSPGGAVVAAGGASLMLTRLASEAGTVSVSDDVSGSPPLMIEAVFPNPVRGRVQVRYSVSRAGQVEAEILDLSGRRVSSRAVRATAGPNSLGVRRRFRAPFGRLLPSSAPGNTLDGEQIHRGAVSSSRARRTGSGQLERGAHLRTRLIDPGTSSGNAWPATEQGIALAWGGRLATTPGGARGRRGRSSHARGDPSLQPRDTPTTRPAISGAFTVVPPVKRDNLGDLEPVARRCQTYGIAPIAPHFYRPALPNVTKSLDCIEL